MVCTVLTRQARICGACPYLEIRKGAFNVIAATVMEDCQSELSLRKRRFHTCQVGTL